MIKDVLAKLAGGGWSMRRSWNSSGDRRKRWMLLPLTFSTAANSEANKEATTKIGISCEVSRR